MGFRAKIQHVFCLLPYMWCGRKVDCFILTINFIIVTNQGYSLQNSSLGQLHSDGGLISIVYSSAGNLLV